MALTFALIAPVQSVFYRVYCRNETIPNAPKHYETRQNMSLGSYGLVWVRSLRKILMQLRGTNFCINCTNSAHFAPSFMQKKKMVPNAPKHYETQQNMSLWSNWVHLVRLLQNSKATLWHEILH